MTVPFDLGKHPFGKVGGKTGIYPDNIPFDIQLNVDPRGDGFFFLMFGPALTHTDPEGISRRTANEVFLLVEDCRKAWADRIVGLTRAVPKATGGMRNELPFQDNWDLAKEPALLEQAAPHLALAGNRLFELIFESRSDDDLKELARTLRQLLAEKPRYIAITSEKFFLPWGMLYTHPVDGEKLKADGSNWKKEGFWGYRHIVQHNPRKSRTDPRIVSRGGVVPLSVNVNEKISSELKLTEIARKFIDSHLHLIAALGGCKPHVRRTTKKQLAQIFSEQRDMLERILYFYCHGHGSSAGAVPVLGASKLILTDDPVDPVSAEDFQLWAKDTPLTTHPLIFINACQGGHMTTMFYQTLAFELLQQGAVGVVGAQIDIPAHFAAAYGTWLFERFFTKGNGRVRLGPLLRDANQHFWDKHHNPLGLVYSLYRGVDCFIDWQDA